MSAMNEKHRKLLIYTWIIVAQILVIVYWSRCKVNYHVDELYSMGYASNFSGYGDSGLYITTSSDFMFNEWISISDLKNHLIVNNEESVFNLPLRLSINRFFDQRNYVILLNIAESIAGFTYISMVPSLCMNIFFFVVAEVALLVLMKRLNMDECIVYLSLAMFGFSVYMISTVLYVRFYMLVVMFMLVMLNLLYSIWNATSWKKIVTSSALLMLTAFLSYKNSELTMVFIAAFMIPFMVALIGKGKKCQSVMCFLICAIGFVYLISQTDIISVIINPTEHIGTGSFVGVEASNNFRDISLWKIQWYLSWIKGLFEQQYFASATMISVLIFAVIVGVIITIPKDEGITITRPMLKGHVLSDNTVFVIVIMAELILYTVICMLCEFAIWRYYCFGIVSGAVVLWYIIDRLLKRPVVGYAHRTVVLILFAGVVVNSLIPFARRNIENIYEDERYFVEAVHDNNMNVMLFSAVENGEISRHDLYDCVNMVENGVDIYISDIDEYQYERMAYPDEFMLWTHVERDIGDVLGDLSVNGYEIEELGEDHCSRAFVCRKL